ncbi:Pectate lyase [Psidium guajava]|nr:Pectate lyase [Psidium guajava]
MMDNLSASVNLPKSEAPSPPPQSSLAKILWAIWREHITPGSFRSEHPGPRSSSTKRSVLSILYKRWNPSGIRGAAEQDLLPARW